MEKHETTWDDADTRPAPRGPRPLARHAPGPAVGRSRTRPPRARPAGHLLRAVLAATAGAQRGAAVPAARRALRPGAQRVRSGRRGLRSVPRPGLTRRAAIGVPAHDRPPHPVPAGPP